jgi:molecular chaperone DnaK (HSP70)
VAVLWNHAREQIKMSVGEGLFNVTPIKITLTVPAIWTSNECNKMLVAAKRAGLDEFRPGGRATFDFIAEPEAAAIATSKLELKDRLDVKLGDTFTVVDCGGE